MNTLQKNSYLYFILTYVFTALWLYQGITSTYGFCLSGRNSLNLFGILAGVMGILTFSSYVRHEKPSVRALGIFTFILGLSVMLIVLLRFFIVPGACI